MKTMQATEAKNNFGKLLEDAISGPVVVQKNGRDMVVVVSKADFDRNFKSGSKLDRIRKFHEESIQQYEEVYKALAK